MTTEQTHVMGHEEIILRRQENRQNLLRDSMWLVDKFAPRVPRVVDNNDNEFVMSQPGGDIDMKIGDYVTKSLGVYRRLLAVIQEGEGSER